MLENRIILWTILDWR